VDGHYRYPKFVYRNTEKVIFPENELHSGTHYDGNLYTEEAIGFVRKQDEKTPFFMILSYPIPHASVIAPEEERAAVRPLVEDEISFKKSGHYTTTDEVKANYIGMLKVIDDAVGSLVATLEKQGKLENTLIIFTSDNGPHYEGGISPDVLDSNGPLRGGKRDLYEGGIRIPFIASWPASIKAGQSTDHPSAFWDFLPTVCDLTDQPVPQDIQGLSFAPTLLGTGEQPIHNHLYWEFHEKGIRRAIQAGDWKLVQYNLSKPEQTTTELFNLKTDIGESNDLSKQEPEKTAELLKLISTARVPSEDFPVPSLDNP
jgi:arylsulfatase A-like enzyme